jgi:hypothetical protein
MTSTFTRVVTLVLLLSPLHAQMVNPAIDLPEQPFTFAATPTDMIGIRDATAGTLITPEGYLYTGYGELMFLIGHPPVAVAQRIRTLEEGYLPIVRYQYEDGTVRYQVTSFGAPLRDDTMQPVNFVRVVATNSGSTLRTSYFSVAWRYTGEVNAQGVGYHRFRRPVQPKTPGAYAQPGVEFDPDWEYGFNEDCAVRSGQVVYMFSQDPKPTLWLARGTLYSNPAKTRALPTTPVLITQYKLTLAPGQSRTLVFKMPVQPMPVAEASELRSAAVEESLRRTTEWWKGELGRGIQIELAERKVTDTFRANLAYIMIARDKVNGDYIQTVNKFHYHAFWLRDGAYLVRAYDVAGYHDLARQCLDFFFRFQRPDGNFVSQEGQYDGWGQTLWAFGQHYRFTRDRGYAERVLPVVRRAVGWLREARRGDPLRLIPATNPRDAEFTKVAAHIPGYNLWALTGLVNALHLAKACGSAEDERVFQEEHDDLARTLGKILDEVTAKTNGYIPPGIDQPGGQDWGNMNLLYPEQNLPPFDRKVTGTIEGTRAKYQEGLMTYAGRLHHYLTMKNTENFIVRGEQQRALEELYAILVHTSATHAGFEWGIRPWGDRDFGNNVTPHGWFGAKYISVIRNMLLREESNDLHLLSVLSPAWTGAGQRVILRNASTYFGTVNLEASFRKNGMTLALEPKFERTPGRIVVHLPWFVKASAAQADGKPVTIDKDRLSLPFSARKIDVTWTAAGAPAGFSYGEAVENYKREYRARYEKFLREGSPAEEPIRY